MGFCWQIHDRDHDYILHSAELIQNIRLSNRRVPALVAIFVKVVDDTKVVAL